MKKCPKCSTILDDSKKKCYMCGADIQARNPIDFMAGFDDQVGAVTSKSQDNVFNNVGGINAKVEQVVNNKTDDATFSSGLSSADFYQKQMNSSLNSMQYDERTPLEKIFSNDSTFKSKDEINAAEAMKKNSGNEKNIDNKKKKNDKNKAVSVKNSSSPDNPVQTKIETVNQTNNIGMNPMQDVGQNNNPNPVQPVVPPVQPSTMMSTPPVQHPKKESKPPINWGNNLNNKKSSNFKFFANNKPKFSFQTFMNFACLVLFIVGFIVIYFTYIKDNKNEEILEIGSLQYKVNDNFKIKINDSDHKNYEYGDSCVLDIKYGTDQLDGFLDNYFDNVKAEFSEKDGYFTQKNTMNIDGNEWVEVTVTRLDKNPATDGGFSTRAAYKFVAVLHNNQYYEIKFVNIDGANDCTNMYKELIDSLDFD